MNLMTSRGCPYHCAFCLWPQNMYGHKQRFRSLDNVFAEIRLLVGRYGVRELNIDDGTFTTRRQRVIEFCQRLKKERFKLVWTCNGRVDNLDDEMLGEMKQSGCKMIRLGVESGSQDVLDNIRKGLTLKQIEEQFDRVPRQHTNVLKAFAWVMQIDLETAVQESDARIQAAKENEAQGDEADDAKAA